MMETKKLSYTRTKAGVFFIKAKNFYEKYKKHIRGGMIFWIGVSLLTLGIKELTAPPKNTYAAAEYTTQTGMDLIKSDFSKKEPFTLVLYRPTCPECKKVETRLMKDFWNFKKKSQADFILMDADKLTKRQRSDLIKLIPQITVLGNKIPTPLTANVIPVSNSRAIVNDISKDNIPSHFEKVLKNSETLKGMNDE